MSVYGLRLLEFEQARREAWCAEEGLQGSMLCHNKSRALVPEA